KDTGDIGAIGAADARLDKELREPQADPFVQGSFLADTGPYGFEFSEHFVGRLGIDRFGVVILNHNAASGFEPSVETAQGISRILHVKEQETREHQIERSLVYLLDVQEIGVKEAALA